MRYYKKVKADLTSFFCMNDGPEPHSILTRGLRVDNTNWGDSYVDSIVQVTNDEYYEAGCVDVTEAQFLSEYYVALRFFKRTIQGEPIDRSNASRYGGGPADYTEEQLKILDDLVRIPDQSGAAP